MLRLFASEQPIQILELGDTMHPDSGYVDKALVQGVETVGQLLAHDYDFEGLVYFSAVLPEVSIRYQYHDEQYELVGPDKAIYRLVRRLEELNAQPDSLAPLRVLGRYAD